jgi:hypothetical protein
MFLENDLETSWGNVDCDMQQTSSRHSGIVHVGQKLQPYVLDCTDTSHIN